MSFNHLRFGYMVLTFDGAFVCERLDNACDHWDRLVNHQTSAMFIRFHKESGDLVECNVLDFFSFLGGEGTFIRDPDKLAAMSANSYYRVDELLRGGVEVNAPY